ncbi:sigma-70 family RNA polymerase sigma factor [Pseudalkalibacillus sp. Hm43]|uniref:sigma-70 family RNA polymerase sigma factor n=1 Tax=Pseudalkalibacillus sp. Hm43 TaxID=3450742 RepID=UPI003F42773B
MRDAKQILQEFQRQKDLLTAFLDQHENQKEMLRFIQSPTSGRLKELNHRFRQFCFECRFIHYMSKFIYFQSINTIRKLRRNQLHPLEEVPGEGVAVCGGEPEQGLIENEFGCPVLASAIERLTDLQQKVIHLHYQKGWKLRRIAESFRVTPQSISKTHRRALEEIKKRMESEKHA